MKKASKPRPAIAPNKGPTKQRVSDFDSGTALSPNSESFVFMNNVDWVEDGINDGGPPKVAVCFASVVLVAVLNTKLDERVV